MRTLDRERRYYRPRLREATLALTERCNLRCRSCGVWRQPSRQEDELRLNALRPIIRQLRELGAKRIHLIEGEPLLHPDIIEIVKTITEQGMASELTTNGFLATESMARDLITAGLASVTISIDAPNEAHDRLRGIKGAFDKAIEAVRLFSAARESEEEHTPRIMINCLLTSENQAFLQDWVELAHDIGADGLNFSYPTFVPDQVDSNAELDGEKLSSGRFVGFDKRLIIPKEDVPELQAKLRNIQAEGQRRGINVWISPDIFFSQPADFETGLAPHAKCFMIRDSIIITAYGETMPCALLDKYSYGSVLEKPLKELWMNERHRNLVQAVNKRLEMCRYCRCHFGHNISLLQQVKRKLRSP